MYRPKNQPFQFGECASANYSLKDNGYVRVINSQRFINIPGVIGKPDGGMAPNTAQGFASGVVPINKKPNTIQRAQQDDFQMGIFSNPEMNENKNNDYMYNERFGNIKWKYKDAQDKLYTYFQAEGMARKLEPEANDGRFQLKFSKFQPVWGNYHVLETDYDNYAIVYSCRTLLFGRAKNEYAWILTREPLDPVSNASEFNRIT